MLALKRRLYRLILCLHPAAFRDRFAREMALDFEDALAAYGFSRLLLDATRSLARQWMSAPASFTHSASTTSLPLHPLLAGHYLDLDSDNLTPFELLRGSVLFAFMLFGLGFALNHGGHSIHAGRDPRLGGVGNPSQHASASQAAAQAPGPDYSQTLEIPTSSLPRNDMSARGGHTIYVNPAAPFIGRQAESWKEFLARCAILSAIVWLTSFLVRRASRITVRIVLVAAGLFVIAVAALTPLHLPNRHAQAELLHPENPKSRFESATIHLRQMAADSSAPRSLDLAPARFGTSSRPTQPARRRICCTSIPPSACCLHKPATCRLA